MVCVFLSGGGQGRVGVCLKFQESLKECSRRHVVMLSEDILSPCSATDRVLRNWMVAQTEKWHNTAHHHTTLNNTTQHTATQHTTLQHHTPHDNTIHQTAIVSAVDCSVRKKGWWWLFCDGVLSDLRLGCHCFLSLTYLMRAWTPQYRTFLLCERKKVVGLQSLWLPFSLKLG